MRTNLIRYLIVGWMIVLAQREMEKQRSPLV